MLRALVVGAGTLAAMLALFVLPAAVSAQGTPTADQYVQPGGGGGGGAGGVQGDDGPNGDGGSGSGGGGAGDVGGQGDDSSSGGDGGSGAAGEALPLDEPSDGGLPFTGSQVGMFAVIAALLLSLALLIRAAERWYARRTA